MRPLELKNVRLHVPAFATGLGDLGLTLGDAQKHKGMRLFWTPDSIFVSYKGTIFGVPLAACVSWTFSDPQATEAFLFVEANTTKVGEPKVFIKNGQTSKA